MSDGEGNGDAGSVSVSELETMQGSLDSIFEMFRDDPGGTTISRAKCKAFLWATGHEMTESDLDEVMKKYSQGRGNGKDAYVRCAVCCEIQTRNANRNEF